MTIEDLRNLEPETETAIERPLSISEQIKAKEDQIRELSKLTGTDYWVSEDSALILSWNRQIEAFKRQLEEEQEKINAEFTRLFDKILAMSEIKGSVRVFTPKDVVDSIQEVVKINRDHKYDTLDIVVALDRITRTDGIRDAVEKLILKRRKL